MKKRLLASLIGAFMLFSALFAFAQLDENGNDLEEPGASGAVYTMTNDSMNNEVVIFDRDDAGTLTKKENVPTGGSGSGGGLDPLGSQGSIFMSENHRWLFVVNATSNEITVFKILPDGLEFANKVNSGGIFPASVTNYQDIVYVLNKGEEANITGFNLDNKGALTPIENSTRTLGEGNFAQVGFDPRGDVLAVTDRGDDEIMIYKVDKKGIPAETAVTTPSSGPDPFGFVFDEPGHLLAAEAGIGAVSSYNVLPDGSLETISPSVPNNQTATCWIAGNKRGNIFTANTGSQNISSYMLDSETGSLTILAEIAGSANRPIDLAVTTNGNFLYALDPVSHGITMYMIQEDGALTNLGTVNADLSTFAQGIAAR